MDVGRVSNLRERIRNLRSSCKFAVTPWSFHTTLMGRSLLKVRKSPGGGDEIVLEMILSLPPT
eukprot:1170003-Karenia_brevis.AAC.1